MMELQTKKRSTVYTNINIKLQIWRYNPRLFVIEFLMQEKEKPTNKQTKTNEYLEKFGKVKSCRLDYVN